MEVKGTIKLIGVTQKVSDKFSKRELVVVTDEKYPQSILIEFNQDGCNALNDYNIGAKVSVNVNLRGREWVNPKDGVIKYFNTIQGWKIGYAVEHADAIQGAKFEDEISDLPF